MEDKKKKKKKIFRLAKQEDKLIVEALIDKEYKFFPLLGPFSPGYYL